MIYYKKWNAYDNLYNGGLQIYQSLLQILFKNEWGAKFDIFVV